MNRRNLGDRSFPGTLDTKLGGQRGTAPPVDHDALVLGGLELHALVVMALLRVLVEVDAAGGGHTLALLLALEDHHGLQADAVLGRV